MKTSLETPNKLPQTLSDPSRCRGSLYGIFIGDALAMPVHWYYDISALRRDYGRVTDYVAPKNPHPDSILWRSSYRPINEKANILHDQAQFWGKKGVHYHQFLGAGENTLNLQLCKLLIESLNANRGYDSDDYLKRYIDYMTTPGSHNDTYVEEYHRHFFTNYAAGNDPHRCGVMEKHIGGLVGLVPIPALLYLALKYHDQPEKGLIVNTNLGGDNVHRGAVLGALLGAANGMESFPPRWIKGLREPPPDLFLSRPFKGPTSERESKHA